MSLKTLFFPLLIGAVAGSQARSLLRQSRSGGILKGVTLDNSDQRGYVPEDDDESDLPEVTVNGDDTAPPQMNTPQMTDDELAKLQASAKLRYIDIKTFPLARCMDGSPAGYYYKPAPPEASASAKSSWMIHLQGGGECDTATRCLKLKMTALGTSELFPRTHSFWGSVDLQTNEIDDEIVVSTDVLLDSRRKLNPTFYDWNMVFVPYCSQDLWVGRQTFESQITFELFFSGHHIFHAVVDTLDNEFGMKTATNLIFSGDSAGGYGVFAHVDTLASKHPDARTVGNPIGGLWSYANPYTGPGHTGNKFSDFRKENWDHMDKLWKAWYDEDCALEVPRNFPDNLKSSCMVGCSFAPFPWTHVKSPLFITEANTDHVLAMMHNWVPEPPYRFSGLHDPHFYGKGVKKYLEQWSKNMTQCLRDGLELMHNNGKFDVAIYMPSCYVHTDFSDIRIHGVSYADAFEKFFFRRGDPPILIEDGFLTNPTCKNQFYSLMT